MDEGLSIHTNAAMDFPLGHDDAGAGEGSRPRDYMIVNGVEEGSIQVEQDCGIVRFPGFPRGRHFVTGQSICESRFGCDWRRVWVKKMVDTTVVTEEARQPRRGQVHRTGGAKGLCMRARRPLDVIRPSRCSTGANTGQSSQERRSPMKAVTGVFRSAEDAKRASEQLRSTGVQEERITLLTPGSDDESCNPCPRFRPSNREWVRRLEHWWAEQRDYRRARWWWRC